MLDDVDQTQGSLWVYLWYERDKPNEFKFGERWVKAGQDPEKEVWNRIKSSVGVRKDLIRDGTIQLLSIWDASDYARKVGRFYQHGRVDDHIRRAIGHRKGSTGEVHELPPDEGKLRVDKQLSRMGQTLPEVQLTAWQARAADELISAVRSERQVILADLCPRFGKTIWAGVLARELERQLIVIASYVLTSFASFEKDLSAFEQFKDMVLVDTADDGYKDAIDAALANGKQVVAFLSMCSGERRSEKISYLFGLAVDRLLIVDEADFGVQRAAQANLLRDANGPDDVTVLMTGTNADQAAALWPVDHMINVVYPELIMEKRCTASSISSNLRHFTIDPSRHALVVDVEFYQMGMKQIVDDYLVSFPDTDRDLLASWTKAAANPARAKGFITRVLQSIFMGQHGHDELNVDHQITSVSVESTVPAQRVAMMFLPGSTTNDNLSHFVNTAQQALPGYSVIGVYGEEMTNRTAEAAVRDGIERAAQRNQSVLLISAGMASRSFSEADITEVYLAYDEGSMAATMQKMARSLTPQRSQGKIARIISLSFDPNRDDKFDTMLLETAINYNKTHEIGDLKAALRQVLATVDMFRCAPDGALRMQLDAYLEAAIARRSISRVIGQVSDLSGLSSAELVALAKGNSEDFGLARTAAADRGKAYHKRARKGQAPAADEDEYVQASVIAAAKKVIASVAENVDILIHGTGASTLAEALDEISADDDMQAVVSEEFGLDYWLICDLLDRNVINRDLIELQVNV